MRVPYASSSVLKFYCAGHSFDARDAIRYFGTKVLRYLEGEHEFAVLVVRRGCGRHRPVLDRAVLLHVADADGHRPQRRDVCGHTHRVHFTSQKAIRGAHRRSTLYRTDGYGQEPQTPAECYWNRYTTPRKCNVKLFNLRSSQDGTLLTRVVRWPIESIRFTKVENN
ncbi:hypothetical protein EVAR_40964_1 [Eumeta japonica]|uniref:Uncharacterized protein n=1 Tax=Eumeta variegata TaxID=151549 RepID=A0A4C1X7S5_EUMVA|nr:hypothetical protein EVAR_40964_1 [Eumeta japonica]